MAEAEEAKKRDLREGFSVRDLADGAMVLGQIADEDAILVRRGDEVLAVGANCTHYHGMLSHGLVVGDTLRCPLHHACFSLRNILGHRERFDAVPFFWSQHYDVAINYVGHAERWDAIEIDGNLEARDCAVSYKRGGRTLAVATISRDLQSLQTEAVMEAGKS